MKTVRILITLAVVIAALGFGSQSASAQLFTGYQTGIKVQNLSSSLATITLDYYYQSTATGGGGALATSASDEVDPDSSNTYFPIPVTNFQGSVVISSSQPIASIANVGSSTGTAWGSYVGQSTGGTSLYLPLLHKNNGGYYSWYSIQNTSASEAATVEVRYSDCTAADVDASYTIAAQAAVVVYQKNETCHAARGFGATITSTNSVPVLAVVMQEASKSILTYTGFSAGTLLPQMPLINMNNSKYHTGIMIQNTGTAPTDVTVTYKPSQAGTECTETQTVNGGEVKQFGYQAFLGDNTYEDCKVERFVGSAAVTANSASIPLVAVVNQIRFGYAVSGSYGAFDAGKATNTVKLPIIMDRLGGYNTGFSVANVGEAATWIKCTFTGSTVTAQSTAAVAVGASLSHQQSGVLANGYSGAATCKAYTDNTFGTEDSAAKIVAVVNELGAGTGDALMVYEGITP